MNPIFGLSRQRSKIYNTCWSVISIGSRESCYFWRRRKMWQHETELALLPSPTPLHNGVALFYTRPSFVVWGCIKLDQGVRLMAICCQGPPNLARAGVNRPPSPPSPSPPSPSSQLGRCEWGEGTAGQVNCSCAGHCWVMEVLGRRSARQNG